MKRLLTIAGSDSGGGAGIQADLKTFAAHGVYGMSVITAVTAQNTLTVRAVQDIDPEIIDAQIDAVFEDIGVDGVKVGMLSRVETIRVVVERLRFWKPPHLVVDPVMFTKNRHPLLAPEAVDFLLKELLPLADLVTPNIPEAEHLVGRSISTPEEMEEAAREIGAMGVPALLIKGGALKKGAAIDILFEQGKIEWLSSERSDPRHTHGTGCTLSSAIAANLALGLPIGEAVRRGKEYISEAIRRAFPLGGGVGPVHHFYKWDPEE